MTATLFDPDGDGTESGAEAAKVLDGDSQTSWSTLCYSDRFLGGKAGVGLVVDLGSTATGTLRIAIDSAPYQVQVFAAPDGPRPTSLGGFGQPVKKAASPAAGVIDVAITTPSRYALVMFNELGKSADCQKNPYRGRISEISWSPS